MNNTDQPNKPWVAYVGPFRFPDGGAAARRVLGNALSIYEAGYDVKIISGQKKEEIKTEIPDFLEVISTEERTAEKLPQFLKRIIYFTMGRKTYNWFKSQNDKPSYIILYSGYTPYILWMKYYCKKNKIPLFFDAVEWYEQDNKIKNLLSPYQLNIELSMRFLLPKLNGLIVISHYLEDYYSKYFINSIRVPPTLKVDSIEPSFDEKTNNSLTLAYTGTPAKKDCLGEVFQALDLAKSHGYDINLHLAGIDQTDVLNYDFFKKRKVKTIPSYISCHGKISHQNAINLVKSCNFSILFRVESRMSSAGFSTKMVESLAVGTPLLANITGDMGNYLTDEENCFLCNSPNTNDIFSIIEKAYFLNSTLHGSFRKAARMTAEKNFNSQKYTKLFGELFAKSHSATSF